MLGDGDDGSGGNSGGEGSTEDNLHALLRRWRLDGEELTADEEQLLKVSMNVERELFSRIVAEVQAEEVAKAKAERFLIALGNDPGGRLRRRQDLPAAAFIDLAALRRMPMGAGGLRVLCISYPWLQPECAAARAPREARVAPYPLKRPRACSKLVPSQPP